MGSRDPPPSEPNSHYSWTRTLPAGPPPVPGYGDYHYRFRPNLPPLPSPGGYGPAHIGHGYAFDPSIPPPTFNCRLGIYPPAENNGATNSHASVQDCQLNAWLGDIRSNTGPSRPQRFNHPPTSSLNPRPQSGYPNYQTICDANSGFMHEHQDLSGDRGGPSHRYQPFSSRDEDCVQSVNRAADVHPPQDAEAVQRRQDEQWIRQFFRNGRRVSKNAESNQPTSKVSISQFKDVLCSALRLVSELSLACDSLRDNLENEGVWAQSYLRALSVKRELGEQLKSLCDEKRVESLKSKLVCVSKRRARLKRLKLARMAEGPAEAWFAEKEAEIDKWRMKQIQAVEEKKREQELKLAADSVLCEVRKKQADVKRMQDILRSLEKLRKLRKEAASRKGIFPDRASERVFDDQLERLRALIRKRTGVYGAEENTLRVMLEGEQEEERKRDLERQQNKERQRQLQRKRQMESMLFGDELPADPRQQPFREYYTQAERSLHALVQIRSEWDAFLVPGNHGEGSATPQGWVLPEAPSDKAWASALAQDDSRLSCI